jgi:tripartite-type tricarboxylate transporter receptor subunit TctC
MSGEVDFLIGVTITAVRFIRDGNLRSLAIMGSERVEEIGNSPTIYELGYKDYPCISFFRGVLAPPGVPKDRIDRLEAAFKKAVGDPGFIAIMEKQGRPVKHFSAQAMNKTMADTFDLTRKYLPLIKEAS